MARLADKYRLWTVYGLVALFCAVGFVKTFHTHDHVTVAAVHSCQCTHHDEIPADDGDKDGRHGENCDDDCIICHFFFSPFLVPVFESPEFYCSAERVTFAAPPCQSSGPEIIWFRLRGPPALG